jgi:hypothetical protein
MSDFDLLRLRKAPDNIQVLCAEGIMAKKADEADFAITINFDRQSPDPARVFRSAQKFIEAFESIDRLLVTAIDSHIEPVLVLEDIEASSLRVWLRNMLSATDDQALKELDWKPQVGKYLVRAKYAMVDLLDGQVTLSDITLIKRIRERIGALAQDTDVKHLPDYAAPSERAILQGVAALANAKAELASTDSVTIGTAEGSRSFLLQADLGIKDMNALIVKEQISFQPAPMILKVKRPDYLGNAKWDFKHGLTPVSAKIEDENWLFRFRNRDPATIVRPGDALRCLVGRTVAYGYDDEVVSDEYRIVTVLEVLPPPPEQISAFKAN